MKQVQFRGSIIQTPFPEKTLSELQKMSIKPIGKKKRLTVLKNEVFVSSNPRKQVGNPKGQRASLFNFLSKNKSSSVGREPMQSLKGPRAEVSLTSSRNYSIVNPVERERALSSSKKKNPLLLSSRQSEEDFEQVDLTKKGTVEIYRNHLIRPIKKKKDENYYAAIIQGYWRVYKENKLEKLYTKIRNCRRFVNILNNCFLDYHHKIKDFFFYRMSIAKPKEIEVTAQEYYLIEHLKELGINSVIDFRRVVASLVKDNDY